MDIEIKRIKSSPYKLVVTKSKEGGNVVGIFDNGKYIEWKNFKIQHTRVAIEYVSEQLTRT